MGGLDAIVPIKISGRPDGGPFKNNIDERYRVTGVCIDYLPMNNGFLRVSLA